MTILRLLPAAIGALVLICACGDVVSGIDEDSGSVTQFEFRYWKSTAAPSWFLLVVDDAPTQAARTLRQRLAEDLRGYFDDLDAADCGIEADPAVYRPIDWRLIVVGASGTLEPRFRESEGLYAKGADASPDLLSAFEEAGGQAIVATEASEVLPFVGQYELVHYLNLVQGSAEPRNDAEAELVSVLSPEAWPAAAVAGTRLDVSSDVPPLISSVRPLWDVIMLDWGEDGYSCPEHDRSDLVPAFDPLGVIWSPGCWEDARVFESFFVADCVPACMNRLPKPDEAGRVACRVFGEFPEDVDCEDSAGWVFLEHTVTDYEGAEPWPVNLCELRQAEGAALDACVNDFGCEDCVSSFCFRRPFTEDDEDDPAHRRPTPAADSLYCPYYGNTAASWSQFRMPHGADQVDGFIRIVCQE